MAWVLIVGFLILGFLVSSRQNADHLIFFKALGLFGIMLVISAIIFYIVFQIYTGTETVLDFGKINISSLFSIVLFVILVTGYCLYWLLRLIEDKTHFTEDLLDLAEYYLNWTLLYLTIYQIVFDKTTTSESINQIISLNASNPDLIIFLMLPSLLSAWMAIVFYKIHFSKI